MPADCPQEENCKTNLSALTQVLAAMDGHEAVLAVGCIGAACARCPVATGAHLRSLVLASSACSLFFRLLGSHWQLITKQPTQRPAQDPVKKRIN
jgi:hypothetical protein